jgi:hypothetical protein
MRLKKHLSSEPSVFDGTQLQPEWTNGLFGEGAEGIAAFIGPYRPTAGMIVSDQEEEIFRDRRLLHVVVRHDHRDVEKIRLQQRLLLDVAKDKLNHRLPVGPEREEGRSKDFVQRWGGDLRRGSRHLSVSAIRIGAAGAVIYLGIREPETGEGLHRGAGGEEGLDLAELGRAIADQYVFEIDRARQPIS